MASCSSSASSLPSTLVDVNRHPPARRSARAQIPPPRPTSGTPPLAPRLLRPNIGGLRLSGGSTIVRGGLTEIEPDLIEEKRDRWGNAGISPEDFIYGEYDGHHTYFETGEKASFWETLKEEYEAAEPPKGFQGLMSWLFLPAVALAFAYQVPGEYLYIGAAVFVVVFCAIEMKKPDKPHNFEPQIYNMERGSRDKLIEDYNTMDIWDFNEKYGELWDFTVKRDKL